MPAATYLSDVTEADRDVTRGAVTPRVPYQGQWWRRADPADSRRRPTAHTVPRELAEGVPSRRGGRRGGDGGSGAQREWRKRRLVCLLHEAKAGEVLSGEGAERGTTECGERSPR